MDANLQFLYNAATQPFNPFVVAKGLQNLGAFVKGGSNTKLPAPGKRVKPPRKKKRTSTGSSVRQDGVLPTGSLQKKRKKKRKSRVAKSIKSRVAALEKNAPAFSESDFLKVTPVTQSTGTSNRRILNNSILLDKVIIKSFIDNLAGVNFDADGNMVKLKNIYLEMFLVNQTTANILLRYKWYICKDDDSEDVLDNVKEGLIDRGLTFANAITAKTAASATSAEIPRSQILDDAEMEYPCYGVREVDRKWKSMSKMGKVILGPGDSINLVQTIKNLTYRPEDINNEPFDHMAGYSVHLLWDVMGALGHNQTTNTNLVTHTGWRVDGKMKTKMTARYTDERGKRTKEIVSAFDNTNAATPVHADNKQSAVEESKFL